MKKKLEAELISIAHRILKLKNKSELDQLYAETQALYEKLAVLKFAETHFGEPRPTIGLSDVENALEQDQPEAEISQPEPEALQPEPEVAEPLVEETIQAQEEAVEEESEVQADADVSAETEEASVELESAEESESQTEEVVAETESVPEEPTLQSEEVVSETESVTEEPSSETKSESELPKITEDELFKPVFEWNFEPKESADAEQKEPQSQINFDDLLGSAYKEPEFIKPEEAAPAATKSGVIPIDRAGDKVQVIKMGEDNFDRSVSLNDRLSRGITVGLNDRIAFVKHLFNNSNEDYNRVLSQLITLDTYDQAKDFIDNMVKPDYNNWEGKEEYEQRFMEVVEKRFS